jgi:mono/diheme cytochrome c family protein
MRRSDPFSLGLLLIANFVAGVVLAGQAPPGGTVFANHCAVCHGPDAAGIPGSFPSLHEQIVGFAKIPAGREYLVMVVTTGLIGELNVGGTTYRGVMPAQSTLTEAEVAAVLNYLASGLGKAKAPPTAFTVNEVMAVRARHADKSPQNTHSLRPTTAAQ